MENTMTERRIQATPELRIERRAEASGQTPYLVGYSAVFNEWTTLYESASWVWREIIRPGAFAAAIAERQDVRALLNHDPNFVLGRTTSGTLALSERDKGLLQETKLSASQTVQDLVVMPVERGDISGMSFGFQVRNGNTGQTTVDKGDGTIIIKRAGERITEYLRGDTLYTDRELLAVDLFDVTVATYPAYTGTSVGLRAGSELDFAAAEREAKQRFEASTLARRDQSRRAPRRDNAERRLRLAMAESN
jgi:HK97 family phage prohead protease